MYFLMATTIDSVCFSKTYINVCIHKTFTSVAQSHCWLFSFCMLDGNWTEFFVICRFRGHLPHGATPVSFAELLCISVMACVLMSYLFMGSLVYISP
jgi:hypothetical protein